MAALAPPPPPGRRRAAAAWPPVPSGVAVTLERQVEL